VTTAISAANYQASSFFTANSSHPSTITTNFQINGLTMSGTGTASAVFPTDFMKMFGVPAMNVSVQAQTTSVIQPYVNVYLLVDISASMLLPSTSQGITKMQNGTGCALACHDRTDGNDSYGWSIKNNVELRFQVVNQGVQNLLTYFNSDPVYQSHVKVGLWSFDTAVRQMTSMTSNFNSVANNFPTPELAVNDEAAATPFNGIISNFVSTVGAGGDGSSSASPQKILIIATDGVNDPTRAWTWNTGLRSQVKVFDTAFCNQFKLNNVTVAIINTPYYPMPWDWGYVATLGQPGTLGGATRVDDIPIALKACAGNNFTIASDVNAIQNAFTDLFKKNANVRLTK
jgi:uncharacterized protein YegL